MASKKLTDLRSWSTVSNWTLLGTAFAIIVSLLFNAVFFADLGGEALNRALVSAFVLPVLLATPVLCYMSMRVRGLVLTNLRLGLVARTDSLTSCLNRGAFTARVGMLLTQRQRDAGGALLMIDADNFKTINDMFGHDSGDQALTIIAQSIRAVLRGGDLVGRMGGEEFGVYLPDADQHSTEILAERIRHAVNLAPFAPDGQQRALSVSIGGAVFEGQARFSDLFRIADQRLYSAKKTGRNCVTVVHVNDHPPLGLKRSA